MTKSQLVRKLQDAEDKAYKMFWKTHETAGAGKGNREAHHYWDGQREALSLALSLIEQVYDSGNW